MSTLTTLRSADADGAGEDAGAVPAFAPALMKVGLNWATFVGPHPFEVVSLELEVRHQNDAVHSAELAERSEVCTAAQLPIKSMATSPEALRSALTISVLPSFPKDVLQRKVQDICYHSATLWCLQPSASYTATLRWPAHSQGTGALTVASKVCTFCTAAWKRPIHFQAEIRHVVDEGSLVLHSEFVRCVLAQGEADLMTFMPSDLFDVASALPFLAVFWYHGLFTLPMVVPVSPAYNLTFFALPNGEQRFVCDLAAGRAEAHLGEGTPTITESPSPLEAGMMLFPWRRHRRVRRVMQSGQYAVIVRNDAAGIIACLERARAYHLAKHGTTWLDPVFIRLVGACSEMEKTASSKAAAASALEQDLRAKGAERVHLICVELVEKSSGDVVAGCCSMAVGRAFHDYTMYTTRRCADSLGSFLTRLVGEALQRCGYTLWYWGFRVDYMADYESHFGAVDMPRVEFYRRWLTARDEAPEHTLEAFLQSGKGMVPYYTETG